MRLVTIPELVTNVVTFPPYYFAANQFEPIHMAGKRTFRNCDVDFGVEIPFDIIGLKIKELKIDPFIIRGVIPVAKNNDGSYHCAVDWVDVS